MHRATRAILSETLAIGHPGPTVVVTCHAPHPASLRSQADDLQWCYASDLTDLILDRGLDLRIHRQIHHLSNNSVGSASIVCNPHGHVEERSESAPALVDEVPITRPNAVKPLPRGDRDRP